jgi:Sensory domain in DIguanylate Cyclases and Two-component system
VAPPRRPVPLRQQSSPRSTDTPFGIVSARCEPRRVDKEHLAHISEHLERQCVSSVESAVLLSCFQRLAFFTARQQAHYSEMSITNSYTVAAGQGFLAQSTPRYRLAPLTAGNQMAREWVVIFLGPQGAAAFVARDCGDAGADGSRRFDFAYTHDHATVVLAARGFLAQCGNPSIDVDYGSPLSTSAITGINGSAQATTVPDKPASQTRRRPWR